MQTVYFISGLGANRQTFELLDLSFCRPVFLDWIKPQPKETLPDYAGRLLQLIPDPKPVIVGLSLGGMLATEMAKRNPAAKVIIISSNKTSLEFPSYLRLGLYLPVYRWIPGKMQQRSKFLFRWIIGPRGKMVNNLLDKIQRQSDPRLTNTFISMILHWKNEIIPPNLVHIHGSSDRLLPFKRVKADYVVKGGTHLMIMNDAAAISILLKKLITAENT